MASQSSSYQCLRHTLDPYLQGFYKFPLLNQIFFLNAGISCGTAIQYMIKLFLEMLDHEDFARLGAATCSSWSSTSELSTQILESCSKNYMYQRYLWRKEIECSTLEKNVEHIPFGSNKQFQGMIKYHLFNNYNVRFKQTENIKLTYYLSIKYILNYEMKHFPVISVYNSYLKFPQKTRLQGFKDLLRFPHSYFFRR